MHISQLNQVQKLNAELGVVRAQISAVEKNGVQIRAANGVSVGLSEDTMKTFMKLALIELTEKEVKLVNQLEDLGVDAEELCECGECADAPSVQISSSEVPEALIAALFGGLPFARGGIIRPRG